MMSAAARLPTTQGYDACSRCCASAAKIEIAEVALLTDEVSVRVEEHLEGVAKLVRDPRGVRAAVLSEVVLNRERGEGVSIGMEVECRDPVLLQHDPSLLERALEVAADPNVCRAERETRARSAAFDASACATCSGTARAAPRAWDHAPDVKGAITLQRAAGSERSRNRASRTARPVCSRRARRQARGVAIARSARNARRTRRPSRDTGRRRGTHA